MLEPDGKQVGPEPTWPHIQRIIAEAIARDDDIWFTAAKVARLNLFLMGDVER